VTNQNREPGHFPFSPPRPPVKMAAAPGFHRSKKISKNSFVDYQRLTQIRSKIKKPSAALFRHCFNVKVFVSHWLSTTFRQTHFRLRPPLYIEGIPYRGQRPGVRGQRPQVRSKNQPVPADDQPLCPPWFAFCKNTEMPTSYSVASCKTISIRKCRPVLFCLGCLP
jgi:hypothetical protein